MPNNEISDVYCVRPFRVEELVEILAIQFDEEGFPTISEYVPVSLPPPIEETIDQVAQFFRFSAPPRST